MEQFTIRDFSGGLNTAMDEANLPANMSASLLNIDFLDSKALSRRNGYAMQTASYITASPVDSLYRYYKKSGDAYWVAICGTALYSMSNAPGSSISNTNVEAETNYIAASSTNVDVTYGLYSGGAALTTGFAGVPVIAPTPVSATIALPLPMFTSAVFHFDMWEAYQIEAAPPITASIQISIGASTFTVPAVAASITTFSYTINKTVPAGTAYVYVNGMDNTGEGSYESGPAWSYRGQALDNVVAYSTATSTAFSKRSTPALTASTSVFAFSTYNDKCYLSSAYDQLMSSVGATFTAVTATNTPSVAFLVEKGRRLFGSGCATDKMKLYYTALDDPEDWGKSGTQNGIYVGGKDSGQECTGLAVANDLLYFFTQTSTYALDTRGLPANWESRTLSQSHGCVAPKSIAVSPNSVIFLSSDGVRAHGTLQGVYSDDGSAFTILSDNITPTLMAYTDAQKKAAIGAVYRNRYWLAIGDDVYVCDLEKRTENNQPPWTKYGGLDVNCFCVTRSDEYGLYSGGKSVGYLYHLDTGGSDNGAAISMLYKTPPLAPKGYTAVKHFRTTHLAAEAPQAQQMTVTVTTDDVSPAAITASFSADTDLQPIRLLTPARGRSAQVKLSSDGLEQDITISELTMTYNPRPKVR